MRRLPLILALALLCPEVARAQGPAIQNRVHRLKVELDVGAALLPADAYTKQVGGTFGVTYHFSDLFAWEIAHGHAYYDWRSGLRDQLENNFGVPPQRFPVLRYMLDSNFVINPIYAKFALLNGKLLYLQPYFLVGVGAAIVSGGEPEAGSTAPGRGLHPALLFDVGVGVRSWLSRRWSLRVELRQYLGADLGTRQALTPLYLAASFAVSLGGKR